MLNRWGAAILVLLSLPVWAAAQGTLSPSPVFTALDSNGDPLSRGKLCIYSAGTTTAATTYSNSTLVTANSNPVVMTSAGRPNNGTGAIYLTPGASYKFVLRSAGTDGTCTTGAVQWTVDGIAGTPTTSGNSDVLGTAGEALTAGQTVYLSDGSGSKTAGQWFKADSANTYSSTTAEIGMVPSSITSGSSGTIRLAGSVTGLSSLTVGTTYYVGTAGAITATMPANARILGVADSTSSLIATPNPIPALLADNGINDFRLTLTTAVPVTTADVTAATTIYAAPYKGNRIALYDASGTPSIITSAQVSIAVPATTSQMYDIFGYSSSGTFTLELLAWTNDTTRATAVVNTVAVGVYTKSGDATRRYLGSFRTTGSSGQTEDSFAKRYLWNYYHRVPQPMRVLNPTANYTYSSATWHQAQSTTYQLAFVVGVAEALLDARVQALTTADASGDYVEVSIGTDSTTTPTTGAVVSGGGPGTTYLAISATLLAYPAVGYHFYTWLERDVNAGHTITWYGNTTGISGVLR